MHVCAIVTECEDKQKKFRIIRTRGKVLYMRNSDLDGFTGSFI